MEAAAKKNPFIPALICGIVALLWTGWNFRALQLGWASRSWPNVPGTVMTWEMDPRFMERPKFGFQYSYTVGTRMYTGTDLDSFGPTRKIGEFVKYPPGAGFPVYYSPQDPSTAFVIAGYRTRHVVTLAVALALWYAAGSMFRDARKRAKEPAY